MKRIRGTAAALLVSATACADDTPARVTTVAIAATPCERPTARLGVGTVVAPGLVLTAAHVVEDDLRDLEIDGRRARVEALDARIDAAVLAIDLPTDMPTDEAAELAVDVDVADAVRILTPTGVIDTSVRRIVTLSVDDTTDAVVRRRQALVLDGAVSDGTSGAPVVDRDGHLVGMVTIAHHGRDVTYVTRAGELRPVIDAASEARDGSVTRSSLAAPERCA